jgi:hypothetical protein
LRGESRAHFLESADENFRPSGVACAAGWFDLRARLAQQLIGHMQHHIRDPNRDYTHGRIYRVTYEGRELAKPPKIYGEPIKDLLALLKSPENDTRTRAKFELGKHDSAKVLAAVKDWVSTLDLQDADYQHQLTEALWVHQWLQCGERGLVAASAALAGLSRPDRGHAGCSVYWRDRVTAPLKLLAVQAADEHPRVRLEAVRAASFLPRCDCDGCGAYRDEIRARLLPGIHAH